ncbi:MAG TPA: restriction endonuclease subunit S [Acidisarcina sp.]
MSFPRYERYKNSGVDWLRKVPEHWQVKRLKFSARLVTERAIERVNPIALENIESWTGRLLPSDTEFEGEGTAIRAGDVIFGKLRPYLAKAYLAQSDGEAVGDFHVMRPTSNVLGKFFLHQLLNRDVVEIIDGSTYGAKMPRVSWDFLSNMSVVTPPLAEQRAIANFVEREAAKTDALIEEQQRLIDLLKEKRQAVISHAVTKGLHVGYSMKASDVDWIGQVPGHWAVTRLGYYATVENGTTPSREKLEYWIDGHVPWLASGEVNQLNIAEASEFITEQALTASSLRLLPEGTIVVGLVGQGKTRGMSAILRIAATINQNLAAICPGPKILSEYILYLFQAMYESLREDGRGGNQAAINCKMLTSLRIPVPPISEQKIITEFLDKLTEEAKTLESEANEAIRLLQERRSTLISDAVTGQIDVRNYTPREAA